MSYSFQSVLQCVLNVIPTDKAVACSEEALELLGDFSEIFLPEDTVEERCDLMLACGENRVNAHVLLCDTILIDGNRVRSNAMDFSIRCKFKSLGYTTLMFDNDNVAVFTKNQELVSALSRRPFVYTTKPAKIKPVTSMLPFASQDVQNTKQETNDE